MITVPEIVEDIIRKSPFIEEALADGLINVSSLARRIKPEITERLKKDVKESAIIMAINRMEPGAYEKIQTKLKNFLSSIGDTTVRSNLSEFTYQNASTLFAKQAEILRLSSTQKEKFCTFSQGVNESTIIVSNDLVEEVKKMMKAEKCISSVIDLSSITIRMPKENLQISGIYYYILKRLAWEGINVVELISTSHEFTVVVHDDDIDRAFSIMMKIKKN
jgi:hypothetical protein